MIEIRKLDKEKDIDTVAKVLRKANANVIAALGLNKENAPTNPAFIEADTLYQQVTEEREFFVLEASDKIIGLVALEKAPQEEGVYYIERLAVLPQYQHNGYGKMLMDYASVTARDKGGKKVSIAIIYENKILKDWYSSIGFEETGTKKFDHLPFTVCFMQKELA